LPEFRDFFGIVTCVGGVLCRYGVPFDVLITDTLYACAVFSSE
jgi:hypothetical protein